ncbi:DUF4244 domain-containing protein [Corynebacterium variabile]|uniref:DUF4244 domain-containing protein n=1 Tax=Corynebacterium variabile TaxID=1727 RepID=UPI003A922143
MSALTALTAQTAQTKMTTLTTDIDEAADLAELTAPTPPDHFGDWDTDPDPDDWGEELPAAQINDDIDSDDEDDSGGFLGDDLGMSTIEYALGCVAAAALGALLYLVVTSDTVESALSGIFERALNTQ